MDTTDTVAAQEPLSLSIVTLDDDADFREYVTGFLSDAGHEVRAVATPADLYAICESTRSSSAGLNGLAT